MLAVVGEAKAGKSTLINALLGDRVLPTDVLQSSSAIVEIFKADKKFLEIKYGDNHTETVVDDPSTPEVDEAFEHLRRIGAVQDRFRPIPTTVIDQYILQRRIAPDRIPFDALEAASERKLRNEQTRRLIEEYVKERTLAHIPTEIRIGFPLKYAYDELCVVDTPGVNAVGGIQDRTFYYLNQANALLFVHSLEGSIEASSFHKFIKQVVPKQTTEALFLVISKSGFKSEFEIAAKLDEARKQFAEYFDRERILHVDSMLKIVADDLTRFDSAAALKAHYKERRNHFAARIRTEDRQEWRDEVINFETKLKLLNNTLESLEHQDRHEQVLSALRNASNFHCLEKALDDFSAQAPQLQLSEVLQAVRRGYANQLAAHEQNINLLKTKSKHPQTFENEISEHQRLLKEYQRELNEFTEVIHRKYTGVNAANRHELQRLKSTYESQAEQATSDAHIRKILVDFNDDCRRLVDQAAQTIREAFSDKLTSLGAEFKANHGITVPTVDVAGIVEKAKQDAYRTERTKVSDGNRVENTVTGTGIGALLGGVAGFLVAGPVGAAIGAGLGAGAGAGSGYAMSDDERYEEQLVFDESKYTTNLRTSAVATIQQVAGTTVPSILSAFVDQHTGSFKTSVGALMSARAAALEELRTRKGANDEILRQIAVEEDKKKALRAELSSIDEKLENLR